MNSRFQVNDFVKHFSTSDVYKVIEVIQGRYHFLYKLQTLENINLENLFPENDLQINH